MAKQMPFIGRSTELAAIDHQLAVSGAASVICFVGRGGIGKTRLLEEVYRRYGDRENLKIVDIINFDDRAFHYVENLERLLIQELGSNAFTDYYNALYKWRSLESDQASPYWIAEQRLLLHQTFIAGLNLVTQQTPLIVRFDTLEKMRGAEVEQFLVDLMTQTHNILFLLAGREEEELGFLDFRERLQKQLTADRFTVYPLAALVDEDSRDYLNLKQQFLSTTIEPELIEKILVLAEGRPILLDLAVEWLARHIPLEWMNGYSLDTLKSLPPAELAPHRQEFEVQLVQHITKIRTPMDQLLLLTSRIFPFNRAMVKTFLDLPDAEVEDLFGDASNSAIIKLLPGGRVTLHDEMRRLIHTYVWPEIDPVGQRQKRDSRRAIDYFNHQVELIQARITAIAVASPRETADPDLAFEPFNQSDVLKYDLLSLWEQLLFHTLFTTKDTGVALFLKLYTQADEDYHLSLAFREVLLRQTMNYVTLAQNKSYLEKLDPDQIYEVFIRQAKFLLDSGHYSEAETALNDILGFTSLRPDQEVDANIQLANVVIRRGRFKEGIAWFEKALALSESQNMPEWQVKAENGLGWAYRLIANRNKACEFYERALARAEELNMKQQLALLYNNLGFVYAYIPSERYRAMSYSETALDLWRETNNKRGIGAAYSTLGCITFMAGHLSEALNYFQRALNIFEPAQDREWLSTVYSWRGVVYLSQERLDLAEKDLTLALAMNVEKDRPMTLSRRALLEMKRNQFEQVQQTIEECYQLSHQLHDALYQLIALRDKARLAGQRKQFQLLESLEKEWADYCEEWGEPQDRRGHGMLFLNFGLLALGLGQPEKGINYLTQGLGFLVELGRYGSDSLGVHIQRLEDAFITDLHLSPAQISQIGFQLQQFWADKHLKQVYPNIARTFQTWAKWKGTDHAG